MLSRTVIILLLSALFLLQFAFAASFNKTFPDHLADVIVEITDDTADKLESGNWFVEVYAPWCGYCAQVFPTIVAVAETLKKDPQTYHNSRIALIDGEASPILGKKFIKSGYPAFSNYKQGTSSQYRDPRNYDSMLSFIKLMASPPVNVIRDRGHLKRLQGTPGKWDNIFIYIGGNFDSYKEFQKCAMKYQSQARFYSPYGYSDDNSIGMSQSVWHNWEGDWNKQFEIMTPEGVQSHKDLMDYFGLKDEDLPVAINHPVGRSPETYHGPWHVSYHEGVCKWADTLIQNPIEELSPFNFDSITADSDVFFLMSVQNQSLEKLRQLSILPGIVPTAISHFDHFAWTTSNLIPRLRQHYRITATDFILVVNRDIQRFWVTEDIKNEETVALWLKEIRTDKYPGEPLYHWSNIFTPIMRNITKYGQRFTTDHILILCGVVIGCLIIGVAIALIIITYCMESVDVKIEKLKQERLALQQRVEQGQKQKQAEVKVGGNDNTKKKVD